MANSKVVSLFPTPLEGDDAPVRTRPQQEGYCRHTHSELDTESHKVFCRDCKQELDAWKVLYNLARSYERYEEARKTAKREADAAQGRLDELTRLEKNAKARVSRGKRELDVRGLERQIIGGLQSAIHAHGPITPTQVGSAAKRVTNQVEAWWKGS